MTINERRIDRCKDCFCFNPMPASKEFCDIYQKQCVNIIECGQWKHDPSIYSEKERNNMLGNVKGE